ncbi:hypothetical protein HETIRDRAFT_406689 [Heterobasidion irregulare TC 32-1]|uniref:Uncharacterized protein n=1 Tax=Heterobasidion irregulare (strain TC 32-1) TaxID=747525 RepID=W4KN64_HETIT|nr:uncharacterized protein HETIRDRAFT_406689 [Heterobasidion irregulare TC 32-1]ETW86805.1 hypothetical protein HETIRDRAFT_406689 [Heterobasidion irregulare TC 32-1]
MLPALLCSALLATEGASPVVKNSGPHPRTSHSTADSIIPHGGQATDRGTVGSDPPACAGPSAA